MRQPPSKGDCREMVGKRLGKGDCERVSQPPGKGVGQRGTSWRLIRRRRTGSEPMHQADALNDPAGGLHASCRPEALRGTSGTELPQTGSLDVRRWLPATVRMATHVQIQKETRAAAERSANVLED